MSLFSTCAGERHSAVRAEFVLSRVSIISEQKPMLKKNGWKRLEIRRISDWRVKRILRVILLLKLWAGGANRGPIRGPTSRLNDYRIPFTIKFMEKYIETTCNNCKTKVKLPLSEIKPGKRILCPKCNLAFSHINKIIQDAERMKNAEKNQ